MFEFTQASALVLMAPLLLCLFAICDNGVLPTSKLVAALIACHKRGSICVAEDPSFWCHVAGGTIRMMAVKVRLLATNENSLRMCLAKAFGSELCL